MKNPNRKGATFRADWRDYHAPGIYMITINKGTATPVLSQIIMQDNGFVVAMPNEFGRIINSRFKAFQFVIPEIVLCNYVIMPDHIHFIVWVKERLKKHLSQYVGMFKAQCSKEWWGMQPGMQGRPFDMAAVRVSSKFTAEELVARKRKWLEIIENGGVLASPFISEDEKAVMRYAMEHEGKVILLRHYPFGERYKPEERLFDLCAEGRLLILGMESGLKESDPITRELALYLNGVAEKIADC